MSQAETAMAETEEADPPTIRQHTYHRCPGGDGCPNNDGRSCVYCDGGLASCTVCGGAEGTLPSECPGKLLDEKQEKLIYAGKLDFRDGRWREEPSMGVSSHYNLPPGEAQANSQ